MQRVTRSLAAAALLASILCPSLFSQDCKVRFSVVWRDRLNNIQQGISPQEEKDLKKAIAKKYPDVCYVPPANGTPAVVVFLVTISSEKYQSTETNTSTQQVPTTGTVTDEHGNVSTVEGTSTVTTSETAPVERTRQVLTLFIETPESDGSFKVRHTVREAGCHLGGKAKAATMATVGWAALFAKCHARTAVIEDAARWIHAGGLTDPLQGVATTP